MAEAPPADRPSLKERYLTLFTRAALLSIVAGLLVGGLGAGAFWWVWARPRIQKAEKRFETVKAVMTLYGLQKQHKQRYGVYANEIGPLLRLMPDGQAFQAKLSSHLDVNTLAVVGSATQFKIEANVLDDDRTLVKIRGPIDERPPRKTEPKPLPLAPMMDGAGAPIQGR